ncbi:MAG: protein phosphatase 2C domain-containing protein [Myxococcales bacterium]|nr:protein phosphatase 2C domain-containing protein [Myxococcales bacterium]
MTSHVGNVRDHNEDAHLVAADDGIFIVCDGMGGHAAGEVASAIGVRVTREHWTGAAVQRAASAWLTSGTLEDRRALLSAVKGGVMAAHRTICEQAAADTGKHGMGTTFTGVVIAGGDAVIAHAGDSRAYLVRGGIAMQLTEDHTLLARLIASGMPIAEGANSARWKGVITNALGFGDDTKVVTFLVPLSDGDRLLLCSDGVSEYVGEAEVGQVLVAQPSPARAAQRLVELALERGGEDNATALVIKVVEVGDAPIPAAQRQLDAEALAQCPLFEPLSPQQRLRATRIAVHRDFAAGEVLPEAAIGSRVGWVLLSGEVVLGGETSGTGTLLYPEALLAQGQPRRADALAVAVDDVRVLAIRGDDFAELAGEDPDLAEPMYAALARLVAPRGA